MAHACVTLMDRYHAQLGKGAGKRLRRIDRAALVKEGAAQAEELVGQIVERAQQDVRVLTSQQAGTFRLSHLRKTVPMEPDR